MIAASLPIHRPPEAKLLVVDRSGSIRHWKRSKFVDLLRPGDLLVANDAATLPASLSGQHLPSGQPIEVRLAGRRSLSADDICRFSAILFGAGDFRTRTEDRPLPPALAPGDWLALRTATRQSGGRAAPSAPGIAVFRRLTRRNPGRTIAPRSPYSILTRTRHRWRCGTCGPQLPARRSRLNPRRRVSCSIGRLWHP